MLWRVFKLLVPLAASVAAFHSFRVAAILLSGQANVSRAESIRGGVSCAVVGLVFVVIACAYVVWLRRLKVRAGCCGRCGYDLRGSANSGRCPECGRPFPRKVASGER